MKKLFSAITFLTLLGASIPQPVSAMTASAALREACLAGKQYREDVDMGYMRPSQAEYEAKAYSAYLAQKSGANRYTLYQRIQNGLWLYRC
jgi:hypothetical protein